MATRKRKSRFVVVTTRDRGVFAGELANMDAKAGTCELKHVRNCLYWDATVKGFLGLAATGPVGKSRVGAQAPSMLVTAVTAIVDCTPDARKQWESAPW